MLFCLACRSPDQSCGCPPISAHRWLGLQQRTCCEVVTWGNTPTEVAPTPPPTSAPDENSLPDATGGGNSTSATALEDGSELSDAVVDREAVMTAELEAEFLRAAGRFPANPREQPTHEPSLCSFIHFYPAPVACGACSVHHSCVSMSSLARSL